MKIKPWMIIGGIVIIVLIVAGVYFYKNCTKEPFKPQQQTQQPPIPQQHGNIPVEPIPQPQKRRPPSIVLFHMTNCGACKTLLPVWKNFTKTIGNSGIEIIELEAKSNQQEVMKNQIKGFPTVRLYPDGYPGAFTEYNGDRSMDSLMKFVKSGGTAY